MADLVRGTNETMTLIHNTVCERDPQRSCVLLGSAAVVAHFYEIGAPCPIGCNDVDALCSQEFFDQQLVGIQQRTDTSKLQVRWPRGRLALRGSSNMTIDIYPKPGRSLMPFTIAHDMSDAWVPETYENALTMAVEQGGLMCKPLHEILLQIARIGRVKDVQHVLKVTPIAKARGIIDNQEADAVAGELIKTLRAHRLYPERYYPRVEV